MSSTITTQEGIDARMAQRAELLVRRARYEHEFKEHCGEWRTPPLKASHYKPLDLRVGDHVIIKNANDFVIGPLKILGFSLRGMYLNWDCWWFDASFDRFIRKVPEDFDLQPDNHLKESYDPKLHGPWN